MGGAFSLGVVVLADLVDCCDDETTVAVRFEVRVGAALSFFVTSSLDLCFLGWDWEDDVSVAASASGLGEREAVRFFFPLVTPFASAFSLGGSFCVLLAARGLPRGGISRWGDGGGCVEKKKAVQSENSLFVISRALSQIGVARTNAKQIVCQGKKGNSSLSVQNGAMPLPPLIYSELHSQGRHF